MNPNICGPGKYNSSTDSCFTPDQIVEMAGAYNRFVSKQKLAPKPSGASAVMQFINTKNIDKKYLLSELQNRFESVCQGDYLCLSRQDFMNEIVKEMRLEIIEGAIRPEGPHKSTEWLGTEHITLVMEQYEGIYPDFKFMGAVPLDCDKLSFCGLFNINYDKLIKKRINKVGVVFNHDVHGDPGSHWVALYISIPEGVIEYCDSMGKEPIEHINDVIKKFQTYYKKNYGTDATYKYNKTKYQRDGSECGVYSCNFIIRRLAGESFEEVTSNYLSFKEINSCRNAYFSNQPSKQAPHKLCDPK
jgi:hypothetical protein